MASNRVKKRKSRKRFVNRILQILKIADTLAGVIPILSGWEKWKWLLF